MFYIFFSFFMWTTFSDGLVILNQSLIDELNKYQLVNKTALYVLLHTSIIIRCDEGMTKDPPFFISNDNNASGNATLIKLKNITWTDSQGVKV